MMNRLKVMAQWQQTTLKCTFEKQVCQDHIYLNVITQFIHVCATFIFWYMIIKVSRRPKEFELKLL